MISFMIEGNFITRTTLSLYRLFCENYSVIDEVSEN